MTAERPIPSAVALRPEAIRPLGILGRIAIVIPAVVGAIIAAPSGFGLFWFIPYVAVGPFLVVRRPGTSIGWILSALAWGFALVTLSVDATAGQFVDGLLGPVDAIVAVVLRPRLVPLLSSCSRCSRPSSRRGGCRVAGGELPLDSGSAWRSPSSPPARSCRRSR